MKQYNSMLITTISKFVQPKIHSFYVYPSHPTFEAGAHPSGKPKANHGKVLKSHST